MYLALVPIVTMFLCCIQETFQLDCLGNSLKGLDKANDLIKTKAELLTQLDHMHSNPIISTMHYTDYNKHLFIRKISVGPKTFFLSWSKSMNAFFVNQVCSAYGGHLAEIAMYNGAVSFIENIPYNYAGIWLGINDEEEEGKFKFTATKRPAFTKFGLTSPDGGRRENCVAIQVVLNFNGTMNDLPCYGPKNCHFLCEMPTDSHTGVVWDTKSSHTLHKFANHLRLFLVLTIMSCHLFKTSAMTLVSRLYAYLKIFKAAKTFKSIALMIASISLKLIALQLLSGTRYLRILNNKFANHFRLFMVHTIMSCLLFNLSVRTMVSRLYAYLNISKAAKPSRPLF